MKTTYIALKSIVTLNSHINKHNIKLEFVQMSCSSDTACIQLQLNLVHFVWISSVLMHQQVLADNVPSIPVCRG